MNFVYKYCFLAQNDIDPMTSFVLTAMTTGGLSRDKIKSFMVNEALKDGKYIRYNK